MVLCPLLILVFDTFNQNFLGVQLVAETFQGVAESPALNEP